MAQPVWVLSVDLQTKTATFQSGMADAAKSARGAFTDIKSGASEMGGSVGQATGSARQAVMLLGDEFGVHLPRGITTFIASLGPVGAAMEAAFPFVAIALGATLLLEHLADLKAAGIKLTEDQVRFGTAAQNAYNALDEKLLQTQIRADELRNDHLGALQLQLKLIDKQSMAELAHQFDLLGKAADVVFEDLKSHWYSFSSGSAGAKRSLDEFQTQYESMLAKGDNDGASKLLHDKLERESKIMALFNQAQDSKGKSGTDSDDSWAAQLKYSAAVNGLKKLGISFDEKTMQSQQAITDTLAKQVGVEERLAAIKKGDAANATAATGHEESARRAEANRQAAEHTQKIGRAIPPDGKEPIRSLSVDERVFDCGTPRRGYEARR